MEMTDEELAAAGLNIELVRAAVLRAVASSPKPFSEESDFLLAFGSTLDGVIQAMAWMVASSGLYETPRDRRKLAEQCREGFLKFLKAADEDLAAGEDWEIGPQGRPS